MGAQRLTKAKPQRRNAAKPSKPKKPPQATINKPFVDGIQSMMNQIGEANLVSHSASDGDAAPVHGSPGRPQGAKNVQRDEVDVAVPRCKVCKSTRRKPYGQPVVQIAAGTDVNDQPYTHVIARPTECCDCGQARRDISYENHPNLSADELLNRLVKKRGKR
jgi:hypothetical protein